MLCLLEMSRVSGIESSRIGFQWQGTTLASHFRRVIENNTTLKCDSSKVFKPEASVTFSCPCSFGFNLIVPSRSLSLTSIFLYFL